MNQKAKKYLSLLLVMLCMFSFWGFKYFPILDDNNQYGVYNLRNDDTWTNVITHYKNYTVRPLALFTDSYVLSYLWHNMYLAVVLMVILHWITTCFLKEIFEKININVSWIWFALFGFAPFLTEAIYWVSASSRIVVSMFFCVLSNLVLIRVLTDEKNKYKKVFFLIVAILLNIIANGYYEQTIVFNFALTLFVLIKLKKYKHIYIPLVSLFTIGAYYAYFMITGNSATRAVVAENSILDRISECFNQIFVLFFYEQGSLILNGIKAGMHYLLERWWISVAIFASIFFFLFLSLKEKYEDKKIKENLVEFVLGVVIFIIPFAPFFIIQNPLIATRNFYIPYIGVAMICDALISSLITLIRNDKIKKYVSTLLCTLIITFSVVATISEINNYRVVYEFDTKVINNLMKTLSENNLSYNENMYITFDEELLNSYITTSNHYGNMLEIGYSWAVKGKLQVAKNSVGVGNISLTVPPAEPYVHIYIDKNFNCSILEK